MVPRFGGYWDKFFRVERIAENIDRKIILIFFRRIKAKFTKSRYNSRKIIKSSKSV